MRIGREPVEPLLLHAAAPAALDAAHLDVEIDTQIAAWRTRRMIRSNEVRRARPQAPQIFLFWRRVKLMTHARVSPNIPTIVRLGVKPGNR